MNAPVVSIVIAAYNAASTLPETLAAVAAQTYRDFEVVVVNDGSKDNTAEVLEAHAAQWPWLIWVTQPNAGVSEARTAGIARARGEIVAFLDADDLWLPTKLERQVPLMQGKPDVVMTYSDVENFYPDGRVAYRVFARKKPARGMVLAELFNGNFSYTSSVMVRRSTVLEVGGFDPRLKVNEDFDLWLRLANVGRLDYVDEVLVRRRLLDTGLTQTNLLLIDRQDLITIDEWVAKRPDLFPADSEQVRKRRGAIHRRITAHALGFRDFALARESSFQALKFGPIDAPLLGRMVAAHVPPLMHAFWWLKARVKGS